MPLQHINMPFQNSAAMHAGTSHLQSKDRCPGHPMRKSPDMYTSFVSVVELPTCVRQNACHFVDLFLGKSQILRIDSVPYAGDEGFVIATPSLRSEEDVFKLFSSR